jgi:serine/threonine-protein kinase
VVRNLRSGSQKVLLTGAAHARYVRSGHLVYVASGQLFAVPFDRSRLEVRGPAVPVVSRLTLLQPGGADYAVSLDGRLAYVDAIGSNRRSLVWVDRSGREERVPAPPRAYAQMRLSPDGTRAALYSADDDLDVWIWDFGQAALTRLTFDPGPDMYPVWSPEGRSIFIGSQRDGGIFNLWQLPADGSGAPQRLTTRPRTNGPHSVTADGKTLIFEEVWPGRSRDLMRLALDSREVTPLLQTPFEEISAQISPNNRWLAYATDATGRLEVHVRPFPNVDSGHWQVSFEGGREPLWTREGRELVYRTPDGGVMSVEVAADAPTWRATSPRTLLPKTYFGSGNPSTYGLTPDGERLLMIDDAPAGQAPLARIVVVQHWDQELTRLVRPQ